MGAKWFALFLSLFLVEQNPRVIVPLRFCAIFFALRPFKRQEGVFCKTSFRRSIAGLNILEAVYDVIHNRERFLTAFINGAEKLGW